MKKRIYRNMLLTALIAILFTSILVTGVVYREFYVRMKQGIRNEALFISVSYDQSGSAVFSELDDVDKTSRITWVDVDGTVLFDSIANAEEMENHIDRPEISDALKAGAGEAVHFSKTLDTQTFYRAVRLKDGTVVRVSTTIDSVYKSVLGFIPYMILISIPVILLCMTVANLLTKKIIVPLNDLNLDNPLKNDVYDELSPLLLRMAKQNEQIKKQFEKLREKQQEFNAITENIREGLIILNDKGQVLSINKSAAGIFDVEPDDSINRHIFILNRSLPLQRAIESAMKGNPHEDKFIKGDKTYNLLASPVKGQDPVKGIILFLLDITEKQNAENIRREFSANVSHELKTPLTTILGYAELLKNNMVKPEDISTSSEHIYNEAKHLISLVDDIINISRLDEEDIQLPFEDIDLLELSRDVVERLAPVAKQKQISISVGGENAIVHGVKQILEEIVYNLCDNAIRYNHVNGTVDVNVSTTSQNVILTVKDNGFGIPKEHQSRVFERFYRIDKSHSRETGGTGLGLSIVKHGAEFHKARIELTSELGKGTSISIIF